MNIMEYTTETQTGNQIVSFKEIIYDTSWNKHQIQNSKTMDYIASSDNALIKILKTDDSVETIKFKKDSIIGVGYTMLFYKRDDTTSRTHHNKEWWDKSSQHK